MHLYWTLLLLAHTAVLGVDLTPTEIAFRDMKATSSIDERIFTLRSYCSTLRERYGYHEWDTEVWIAENLPNNTLVFTSSLDQYLHSIPSPTSEAEYPKTHIYVDMRAFQKRHIPTCLIEINKAFHGYTRQETHLKRAFGIDPLQQSRVTGADIAAVLFHKKKYGLPILHFKETQQHIRSTRPLQATCVDATIGMAYHTDAPRLLHQFLTHVPLPIDETPKTVTSKETAEILRCYAHSQTQETLYTLFDPQELF